MEKQTPPSRGNPPGHTEHQFKTSHGTEILFSSNFDSGNLKSVQQVNDLEYNLQVYADCERNCPEVYYRNWFFFSCTTNHETSGRLALRLTNISPGLTNLYSEGYKPVYYIVKDKAMLQGVVEGFNNELDFMWKRLEGTVSVSSNEMNLDLDLKSDREQSTGTRANMKSSSKKRQSSIGLLYEKFQQKTISVCFDFELTAGIYAVYFAFCYPMSYSKSVRLCNHYALGLEASKEVYFHKETLTYSKEGRLVEMITLSSFDQITSKREQGLKGLFPESIGNLVPIGNKPVGSLRCLSFSVDKPIVFISCRVHPGETQASYVLQGLLDFLTNPEDLRARILRKFFVFKIIPMINPDGVFHGHHRYDTNGYNMNRHYINPNPKLQPEIYAIRRIVLFYSQQHKIKHFLDLHGHSSSKGHFVFGNNLDFVSQVENVLFPKLLELNNRGLNYSACVFGEKSMKVRERGDKFSKEGSSRVFFYKAAGIVNCYTIEASCFKRRLETLNNLTEAPLFWETDDGKSESRTQEYSNVSYLEEKSLSRRSNEEPSAGMLKLLNVRSDHKPYERKFNMLGNFVYQKIASQDSKDFFTVFCYLKLGFDLMVSILDYEEINPLSCIIDLKFSTGDSNRLKAFVSSHRKLIAERILFEDSKFRYNLIYADFARNIDSVRKQVSVFDKIVNSATQRPSRQIDSRLNAKRVNSNARILIGSNISQLPVISQGRSRQIELPIIKVARNANQKFKTPKLASLSGKQLGRLV